MRKVRITVAQVTVDAELFDTSCASEVARILPLHAVLTLPVTEADMEPILRGE